MRPTVLRRRKDRMDIVEQARRIALGKLVATDREELAQCQARLSAMLGRSAKYTRALIKENLDRTYGPGAGDRYEALVNEGDRDENVFDV